MPANLLINVPWNFVVKIINIADFTAIGFQNAVGGRTFIYNECVRERESSHPFIADLASNQLGLNNFSSRRLYVVKFSFICKNFYFIICSIYKRNYNWNKVNTKFQWDCSMWKDTWFYYFILYNKLIICWNYLIKIIFSL